MLPMFYYGKLQLTSGQEKVMRISSLFLIGTAIFYAALPS